jgi:type IV pilus assembly protein PilF
MLIKRNAFIISLLSAAVVACSSLSPFEKQDLDAANIHLQLGQHYFNMNMLDVAKENLELALKDDSSNIAAHNTLAVLYNRIGQKDKAKDEFARALDLAPDDLGVQNNFGQFLCDRGDFKGGMELLNKAGFNPLNRQQWLALTNAGYCKLAQQQKAEAETYFKQALQVNDSYPPALLAMQKLSFQRNDLWSAKGYWQRSTKAGEQNLESLSIAVQTERALGNNELAKEYQRLLLEKFPLSNEAKQSKPIE